MFFSEPTRTPYDLNLVLFGIPIRVHPFFWLLCVILGYYPDEPVIQLFTWVAAVFFSVVIHEMGHALVMRYFGEDPWIVLYSFGGLAISERGSRTPGRQMLISLAGPMAGFAFVVVMMAIVAAIGHHVQPRMIGYIPWITFEPFQNDNVNILINQLLMVNILWGLLNLLPVFPLDGGQFTRAALIAMMRSSGFKYSIVISLVTAIAVAAYAFQMRQPFLGVMFGLLAYGSFQLLQNYRSSRGGW